ncbi:hypothetical protein O6P43_003662 [Quillaja saponaria]|uniref:Uncharacterized protein n=1 Tax=Quillaja saponaria TaxID=32244 RepID=A0AAD7VM12_QUISA|nr:hypothetical protein O6P43_003662 [Quillaja saponaria]
MAGLQSQLDALNNLVKMMNNLDDGKDGKKGSGGPSTPEPGNKSGGRRRAGQKIRGLTNQTGFVDGNANGIINFKDVKG